MADLTWVLQHRRDDGTFVILLGDRPYHVLQDDPLFPEVATAADGVDLPPEPVPPPFVLSGAQSVTRAQGLIALLGIGITEQAIRDRIALIEDATEREITRIRFEQQQWLRDSAFIAWGAQQFDLSDEAVDALFLAAANL